jgi:glutathione-regulated potassium-efflux system protein KefB
VCVDDKDAALKIVELVKETFPQAKLLVRAFDRAHALELMAADVEFLVRETFAGASDLGEAALRTIGIAPDEAAEIAADVRRRDEERLALQMTGGALAGRELLHSNRMKPTPLAKPAARGRRKAAASATGAVKK